MTGTQSPQQGIGVFRVVRDQGSVSIFISAGEASGDLHGAFLAQALLKQAPGIQIACLGGDRLRSTGVRTLVDNRQLAVVGVFEVARHLQAIHGAWRTITRFLEKQRPSLVVLIDFPDFNLLLARKARQLGCKIFYYISPQVWAWRTWRVRALRRLVDRMAVILPFESDFYAGHNMRVHFVGHPLPEMLANVASRIEARNRYQAENRFPVVGLLPGSRASEVRAHLPLLLETAAIVLKQFPAARFLLPVAPSLGAASLEQLVAPRNLPIDIVSGDTWGVIRACDLILTASGTVTLEAAILGTPMVIFYRVSCLSSYIGRCLIRAPFAGLPNLIAEREIAPELIQEKAHPALLADAALALLQHPQRLEQQRRDLAAVCTRLGDPGVADRVAHLVLDLATP
jgi:lipid-A-disaccharide synthase